MRRISFCLITLFSMIIQSQYAFAAVSPDKLVKVTDDTNVKCVEYYQYKGDMYCSTEALSAAPVDAKVANYEKLKIHFDSRAWKIAWGKQDAASTTVEYVPIGDDINSWKELITSQFFKLPNEVTPKKFVELFLNNLKESGYKPIVTFIKTTPDVVIFEFRIDKPTNQIQDELQIVMKGEDGLYALHYAIKEKDMGKEKRALWINNLSQSVISPPKN